MDSREFDDLIKDSLDGFSQLPEKEVKKAIFGKLFYQNLWVFHKMKLMASLLMIGGSSLFINYYLNDSDANSIYQSDNSNKNNQSLVENTTDIANSKPDNSSINELTESTSSQVIDQYIEGENEINDVVLENLDQDEKSDLEKEKNDNHAIDLKEVERNLQDFDVISSNNDQIDDVKNEDESIFEFNKLNPGSNNKALNSSEIVSTLKNNNREKVKIDDKVNSLSIVALHSCYPEKEIRDVPSPDFSDYANEHKRGFTFDAFFSPFNKVDVDNFLDPLYNRYWWDFYKEHDMERSGIGGGVNVSYNYRNFKLNSGFNFDQVYDYKPHYEYFTNYDSIYGIQNGNIVLLNIELISGLQVFGPADSSGLAPIINTDTTVVFYVDPNDENLSHEIGQSANRYNYLRIPLTLGYEFTLKRASFEVNAGVEYTRLIRANGISYKDGYVAGIRPYYYYEDMVATTYQNNMSSVKINNWNYVANAVVRVRMTRSLDFFSSFRFQYNTNNIMSDDYLLQKTYKKYGFNIGLTYHLNKRMSLKEMVAPSWN